MWFEALIGTRRSRLGGKRIKLDQGCGVARRWHKGRITNEQMSRKIPWEGRAARLNVEPFVVRVAGWFLRSQLVVTQFDGEREKGLGEGVKLKRIKVN